MSYRSTDVYNELLTIPVIDTHEHLVYDESTELDAYSDVLQVYLSQYMKSDLISAGLKPADWQKAVSPQIDLLERWRLVEPYWNASRFTGYARSLDYAVQRIYGVNSINAQTIEELAQKFSDENRCGHEKYVLHDLCGIEKSCVDLGTSLMYTPNPLFCNVWQPTAYISPKEEQRQEILSCQSLEDWCALTDRALKEALACNGNRIIKLIFAYERSLLVETVSPAEAERLFMHVRKEQTAAFPKQLQDYMIHRILHRAQERELTVQIHTGHLEGNGGNVAALDPSLLTPLFEQYPGVKFDIFHIGYPFEKKLVSICKSFPNVFVDMCWAHILSPKASRSFLREFLECVPYTKLSAFGGDYLFVDGVCGHLELCRQNVALVLSQCITERFLSPGEAMRIAYAIFYSNPKGVLQL